MWGYTWGLPAGVGAMQVRGRTCRVSAAETLARVQCINPFMRSDAPLLRRSCRTPPFPSAGYSRVTACLNGGRSPRRRAQLACRPLTRCGTNFSALSRQVWVGSAPGNVAVDVCVQASCQQCACSCDTSHSARVSGWSSVDVDATGEISKVNAPGVRCMYVHSVQ
jgi:hypothetical protein